MEVLDQSVDRVDIKLGETAVLRISVKQTGDKLFLDCRKWNNWSNLNELIPSKKGIMLDFKTWLVVLEEVKKLIASNSGQDCLK